MCSNFIELDKDLRPKIIESRAGRPVFFWNRFIEPVYWNRFHFRTGLFKPVFIYETGLR